MQKQDKLMQSINKIDTNFKFTQKLNEISFSEIKALVGKHAAIIEWYITNNQIITFIITHNEEWKSKKEPHFWASSCRDLDNLIKWCKEYFEAYYAPSLKEYKENNE